MNKRINEHSEKLASHGDISSEEKMAREPGRSDSNFSSTEAWLRSYEQYDAPLSLIIHFYHDKTNEIHIVCDTEEDLDLFDIEKIEKIVRPPK